MIIWTYCFKEPKASLYKDQLLIIFIMHYSLLITCKKKLLKAVQWGSELCRGGLCSGWGSVWGLGGCVYEVGLVSYVGCFSDNLDKKCKDYN